LPTLPAFWRFSGSSSLSLFQRGVPLHFVESALLLGSMRRGNLPEAALPLPPVCSIAYFSSVIDELQQQPPPAPVSWQLRSNDDQLSRLDVSNGIRFK